MFRSPSLSTLFPYTTLFRSILTQVPPRDSLRVDSVMTETGATQSTRAAATQKEFRLHVNTPLDRKSTRLNSSHGSISYAVFCLKKKNDEPKFFVFLVSFESS